MPNADELRYAHANLLTYENTYRPTGILLAWAIQRDGSYNGGATPELRATLWELDLSHRVGPYLGEA